MSKVLFIMTSADHWTMADGSEHPTGFWAEEAVVPFQVLTEAGHEVTIATPSGAPSPVDEASLTPAAAGGEEVVADLRRTIGSAAPFQYPIKLADVNLSDFDAVYVPGGHGPMEDLAVDPVSGSLLILALNAGLPLGVVCHGPAALLAAISDQGRNSFAGYRITAFTNEEERMSGTAGGARWLLEDKLRDAGIEVVVGAPFEPHIERDRTLLTGQNPASSRPLAEALLKALS